MAKDNVQPLLQWRKIVGDKSSKGIPWSSPTSQERLSHSCSKANDGFCSQEKIAEADDSQPTKNEEGAPNCRTTPTRREIECNRIDEKKCHIVQMKKTKYSHLLSSQEHVMPKEEDISPVVYRSQKYKGKKEVAVIWLQQFTVVDEY